MEHSSNLDPTNDSSAHFPGDKLSIDEFRATQTRIFEEHRRNIESYHASGVEYDLCKLYDENRGAFEQWRASLDEGRNEEW